jgi:general secretion pathway protein D
LSDKSPTNPAFDSFSTVNQLRQEGHNGPSAHADITMGEFSLGVDIKALEDISSKDVLASPRVTTLPNKRVTIKLITETYFVEDFDESETEKTTSENGDINYTYVGPFPNFESEPEPLGITFGTTPSISNDGKITMVLEPQISSLVGWTVYEGTNEDGAQETLRTPNIARRSLRTEVTIKDGETLVVGGVIEDNVTQRKDKVPLLGDIPLIGRLFQSRSQSSNKKNLLIFVTPRLVKPDGTFKNPENHEEHRGIARFL